MHTLKLTASSSLSLPQDSYIYTLAPSTPGSFAAISSDDSLRVFDAAGGTLSGASVIAKRSHRDGTTSLKPYAGREGQQPLLVTAGRDGMVKMWDTRSREGRAVVKMSSGEY